MQKARAEGRSVPKSCREPEALQYKKACSHGMNVERFLEVFPDDRIHIIFFEDFCGSSAGTYRSTLAFLELKDDGRVDFPPVNQAKTHARNALTRLLISPPGPLGRMHAGLRTWIATTRTPVGRWIEDGARKLLATQSTKRTEKKALSPEEREEILSELRPDIELLEKITSRDLSSWKRP